MPSLEPSLYILQRSISISVLFKQQGWGFYNSTSHVLHIMNDNLEICSTCYKHIPRVFSHPSYPLKYHVLIHWTSLQSSGRDEKVRRFFHFPIKSSVSWTSMIFINLFFPGSSRKRKPPPYKRPPLQAPPGLQVREAEAVAEVEALAGEEVAAGEELRQLPPPPPPPCWTLTAPL